jgi:hypothetical protein
MGGFAARRQPAEALQATSWVRNQPRESGVLSHEEERVGESAWARAHGLRPARPHQTRKRNSPAPSAGP